MKVKNNDLTAAIDNITSLRPISMDGDITLSLIKRRKELISLREAYEEAKTTLIEAVAKKGVDGNVIKIIQDTPHGQTVGYEFDTPEIQQACLKQINELGNKDNDLVFGIIESSRILSFRTTPEQLEGLLLISKPE